MGTRWVEWRLLGPVPPRPAGAEQAYQLCAWHLITLALDSLMEPFPTLCGNCGAQKLDIFPCHIIFFNHNHLFIQHLLTAHYVSGKALGTHRRKPQSSTEPLSSCNMEFVICVHPQQEGQPEGGGAELAGMGCDSDHQSVASCLPHAPHSSRTHRTKSEATSRFAMVTISCHLAQLDFTS